MNTISNGDMSLDLTIEMRTICKKSKMIDIGSLESCFFIFLCHFCCDCFLIYEQ